MADGLGISFKISAIDDFSKTMGNLQGTTKKAFETIGQVGQALTGIGVAGAVGLGAAVKVASDFNAQMSRVSAISGATGDQLEQLRQSALDLGASTSKSASEVAVGMEEMAKKGFEVNEVMSAMPGIIAASEASGEDLAAVSNVVASALNSFQLEASEASRVADVMAMAANKSSADVTDLGYAFKYAAPLANTLGYSMETLAAATGIMTDAGLEGQQAGTTLRMALIRLSDPPTEAAEAIAELGLKITDATGNVLPFDQIIQQLADSTQGMGNAAKLAALSQIFGAEAASGMLTVIDAGPEKLRKFTDELVNSEGSANKTATAMKDNLKGAVEELGGAFETLLITVGTTLTPVIQKLTEMLTSLLNKFNGLSSGTKTIITAVIALSTVFALIAGPILIMISLLPALLSGLGAIAAALGTTVSVMLTTIAIIGGVVTALALIGAALVLAYNKVGWFRDMVDAAWAWIKNAFNTALQFIIGIVQSAMSAVTAFAGEQLAKFQALWNEHGTAIMTFVKNAFTGIQITISIAMAAIKAIFQAVWPIISNIVRVAWEYMKMIVGSAIDIVVGLIDAAMSVLKGDWSGAWNAIKGIAENIWHNIEGFFRNIDLVQIGKDIIAGLIRGIGSMGGAVMRSVSKIANSIPNGVKKLLGIHSPSRVLMELGGYTAEGLAVGIGKGLNGVQRMAGAMATAATPNIGGQSLNYGLAGGGSMSNAATAGTSTSSQPVVIQLTLPDGRVLAEASYSDMDQLFANKFSNELRVNGVKA
jgi:TP901 family phage tail tape measure protein